MQAPNSNAARTLRGTDRPEKRPARSINQLGPKRPAAMSEWLPGRHLAPLWGDLVAATAIGLLIYALGKMFWNAFWLKF